MGNSILSLCLTASLLSAAQAQAPPADPNRPVLDVLRAVRERAEEQKRADQRRALLLVQQARTAQQAGRLAEAVELARKAQQLFPESAEIKQFYRNLLAAQRARREQADQLTLAQDRLKEALQHAEQLTEEGRYAEAQDLAEALREATKRFPAQIDVTAERQAVEKLLANLPAKTPAGSEDRPASDPEAVERLPPPVEIRPDPDAALRRGLNKSLHIDWQNKPLGTALQEIARASGIPIKIDPALERLRIPTTRKLDLQVDAISAWQLIKLVTELTGTDYILAQGQVVITTKAKALEYTVARARGRPDKELLDRLLESDKREAGDDEATSQPHDPTTSRLPDYLRSGAAFLAHIEALLKK